MKRNKIMKKNFLQQELKYIGGKKVNGKKEVLVILRLSKIKNQAKLNVFTFKNKLLKLELIFIFMVKICVNQKL